jgi:hypothetical protein
LQADQCAWASLQVQGVGWLNATVSIQSNGQSIIMTATLPSPAASAAPTTHAINSATTGAVAVEVQADALAAVVTGSSYGWGPIPMMNAYDQTTGLPVLPWKKSM